MLCYDVIEQILLAIGYTMHHLGNLRHVKKREQIELPASAWSASETKDAYLQDAVDVVYYINLDRSTNRREDMESSVLSDPAFDDIPIHRISAVDGKNRRALDTLYPAWTALPQTPFELGCLFSHMSAIRSFAMDDRYTDYALIFEDDVTMEYKPTWRVPLEEVLAKAPLGWDVLMLGVILFRHGITHWYNANDREQFRSTLAYVITKDAAKRFTQQHWITDKELRLPLPYTKVADVYLYQAMKTYVFGYPYFTYPTENDSLLHPGDLPLHERSKQIIDEIVFSNENK